MRNRASPTHTRRHRTHRGQDPCRSNSSCMAASHRPLVCDYRPQARKRVGWPVHYRPRRHPAARNPPGGSLAPLALSMAPAPRLNYRWSCPRQQGGSWKSRQHSAAGTLKRISDERSPLHTRPERARDAQCSVPVVRRAGQMRSGRRCKRATGAGQARPFPHTGHLVRLT